MNWDGTRRRIIRRFLHPFTDALIDKGPVWSPDGRAIALAFPYGRARGSRTDPPPQRHGIYVIRHDGSGFRRVAEPRFSTSSVSGLSSSPDGRRLAYAHDGGIWTVSVATRTRRRAATTGRFSSISWAPSQRILFTSDGDIYSVASGERPVLILG